MASARPTQFSFICHNQTVRTNPHRFEPIGRLALGLSLIITFLVCTSHTRSPLQVSWQSERFLFVSEFEGKTGSLLHVLSGLQSTRPLAWASYLDPDRPVGQSCVLKTARPHCHKAQTTQPCNFGIRSHRHHTKSFRDVERILPWRRTDYVFQRINMVWTMPFSRILINAAITVRAVDDGSSYILSLSKIGTTAVTALAMSIFKPGENVS